MTWLLVQIPAMARKFLLGVVALAATASADRVTTVRQFQRAARDAHWVGIHQVGTASRAGEICPASSPMLQVLLSCRAPK